jgi:hypothetical protein
LRGAALAFVPPAVPGGVTVADRVDLPLLLRALTLLGLGFAPPGGRGSSDNRRDPRGSRVLSSILSTQHLSLLLRLRWCRSRDLPLLLRALTLLGDGHRASRRSRKSAPRADMSSRAEAEQTVSAQGLDVLGVSLVSSPRGMIPAQVGWDTLGGEAQASGLRAVPSRVFSSILSARHLFFLPKEGLLRAI